MRPSSRAAPGDAASAASTRRAQSRAWALGRSAAWIGSTWLGWMHSLAPKALAPSERQVDEQARGVVELRGDAGDGGRQARDA